MSNKLIAAYIAIAILTFGYAATNPRAVICPGTICPDPIAMVFASGLWPFYWSWEIFDVARRYPTKKHSVPT